MKYVGSKKRLSKELTPIIQSYITKDTKGYLEPFVGGANVIDKIHCKTKIGCDIHKELIELLKYTQKYSDLLPERILEDEYIKVKNNRDKYESWYVGLVGFCSSFGSKYFGGYARNTKKDNSGDWSAGSIRTLKKQANEIKDISFINTNFTDIPLDKINNYVIYCDIPYKGTTKYGTPNFPYDVFYQWVKEASVYNTVLISEYNMPNEFKCIYQKEVKSILGSKKSTPLDKPRIEKLFVYKEGSSNLDQINK